MRKYLKIMSSVIAGIMVVSSSAVLADAKTITADVESDCGICNLSECTENNCDISCLAKCFGNLQNCDKINSGCYDILNECDVQFILNDLNCADIITFVSGNCTVTEPTQTVEPTENTTVAVTEPETTFPVVETLSTEPTESTTVAVTEPETTAPVVELPTTEPVEESTSTTESTQPSDFSEFNKAYADEVIRLVNIEREKYGLPALARKADATQAAEIRSKEIKQSFSHTRPDGTSFSTIAKDLGISYKSIGENIAYGYSSPESVVKGWMNSQGHRENILSASFNGIGVGCYESNGVLYWTQIFIGV